MNIYFFVFACALAGLLFGYDAGMISGAMLFIKKDLFVSNSQMGSIIAAMPIGAFFGAVFIGRLSDKVGRKIILLLSALLFVVGSFETSLSTGIIELILGRVILGVAIGASSALAPMYICEIADEKQRGMLVTLYLIAINLGIMLSYVMNAFFMESVLWRPLMVVGVIPALLLGVCAYLLPESPRWLMTRGKVGKASSILIKLYGSVKALTILEELTALSNDIQAKTCKLWDKRYRSLTLLTVLVSVVSQLVGIKAIIYYAPTIFLETGLSTAPASILAAVAIGVTYTVAAVAAARIIDRIGRRQLLLSGLAGVIISLILITWTLHHAHGARMLGWLTLIGALIFVFCQGMCLGPASLLIPAEVFPSRVRGMGMGIAIGANWATNALVLFLFPITMHHFGLSFTFLFFLMFAIIGFFACYLWVPETKGATLEQIELSLHSGIELRQLACKIKNS